MGHGDCAARPRIEAGSPRSEDHRAAHARFRRPQLYPAPALSANTLYPEQYTAWHLVNAPVVSTNVTLTKLDLIKF
jgi:hypothetical protein